MTYPQEGDFLVRLQDDQYNDIEILADTGGLSAPRTKSVWLKAGTYNLDITADAPWMITASTV